MEGTVMDEVCAIGRQRRALWNDARMKVRIGFGFGVRTKLNDGGFAEVVDALEALRFDSLWLSERIGGEAPDPLVGLAFAAGRTRKLKFGMSVMVLPGRNPVVLAKELATLDRLSGGRLLPAFGLGVADPHEQQAFGVERGARAKRFDEAIAVLRGCWAEGSLNHHGEHFHYDDLRVLPKPLQHHVDIWLGGIAPSELRRVGRLADGWLPSFVTPDDAARGREAIETTLAEHGRSIDEDHYGALIPYALGPLPAPLLDGLAKRRPDLADPSVLVPQGWDELMATIDRFVAVGTTKFVILPIVEPTTPGEWVQHLEEAAPIVLARQT
jgi:probable F420-dependent oxidoreductase